MRPNDDFSGRIDAATTRRARVGRPASTPAPAPRRPGETGFPQGVDQSPSASMAAPWGAVKRTNTPPLEAKRWPGARPRRG